jgi:hypothetical protein
MKPEVVAQARRFYHHVLHGGTLRPDDVSFMIEALEEAYEARREWVELTDEDIDEIKQNSPVYVSAKAVSAIVPMVEAKLKEKNT